MATIRQKKFAQQLPKNNFIPSKTARQSGYSESYLRSGEFYQNLRKPTHPAYDMYSEDAKKLELKRLRRQMKQFLKDGDRTNYMRAKELEFKARQWLKDIHQNESPDTIVINYGKGSSPLAKDLPQPEKGQPGRGSLEENNDNKPQISQP